MEMKRVSQVLKFAIVIQRGRSSVLEAQLFEELDFLQRRICAKRAIFQEFSQSWLFLRGFLSFLFQKFKFLQVHWGDSAIQDDLQGERREINVPRYDQRVEERNTILRGYIEYICVQEFEDSNAHLFIASIAQSSHEAKPGFAPQFFPGQRLDHVQQFLGHQPFKLAEGFFLKNRADLCPLAPFALFNDQLANFLV